MIMVSPFTLNKSPNQDASDHVLGVVGKLLMRGVHGLGSMAFGLVGQKFLHIE
jgi:hypothetical protein